MNIKICIANFEEYDGQFPKGPKGDYKNCTCLGCNQLRMSSNIIKPIDLKPLAAVRRN